MFLFPKRYIILIRDGVLQLGITRKRHIDPRWWFNLPGIYERLAPDLVLFGEIVFDEFYTPAAWLINSYGQPVLGQGLVLAVDGLGYLCSLTRQQTERVALVNTGHGFIWPRQLVALPCAVATA